MKTDIDITKRTKGEWKVSEISWTGTIIYCNRQQVADCFNEYTPQEEAEANASYICLAVNSHEKLLAAIYEAKTIIYNLQNGMEHRNSRELQAIFDEVVLKSRGYDR